MAATSPPFFIAFTHQRALPELVFDRGEWWLRRVENLGGPRVELIPSPPTWDFFSYQLKAILPPPPQTQLAEVPTRG
ncbi:MAG: hypothetical protein NZ869_10085, partial [Thermoanaerobaculum sp.]|nr:hypothetical protein [Thermoanaerobaculum sp.]